MSKNTKIIFILIVLVIVVTSIAVAILGYTLYSNTRLSSSSKMSSSTISSSQNSSNQTIAMDMTGMVRDDKSFVENMIPHHQEAIDSSKTILNVTTDPDIKTFAQNVITDQSKEIDDMKTWYKSWYNTEYTPSANYFPMMDSMKGKKGVELDKTYIRSMIEHHKGAVQMAQKVLAISTKDEIKTLAQNIVSNQNMEIKQLSDWLMTKFNDHAMMGM